MQACCCHWLCCVGNVLIVDTLPSLLCMPHDFEMPLVLRRLTCCARYAHSPALSPC